MYRTKASQTIAYVAMNVSIAAPFQAPGGPKVFSGPGSTDTNDRTSRIGCTFQLAEQVLELQLVASTDDQESCECREAGDGEQQDQTHRRLHRRGDRMDGPEPASRHDDQGNIKHTDNGQYGSDPGPAVRIVQVPSRNQITAIKGPEDERRDQPRIPGPPGSPRGMGPQGTSRQREARAEPAQFRGSLRPPVPP